MAWNLLSLWRLTVLVHLDYSALFSVFHAAAPCGGKRATHLAPGAATRPRAIVHVGPHKTGSTSLQRFMRENAHSVEREDRYWMPKQLPGYWENWGSHNLAICLDARRHEEVSVRTSFNCSATKAAFRGFVEEVAARNRASESTGTIPNNILISSEEFDRPTTDIDWLKTQLESRGFEVHVILYYRHFHQWLVSVYNEVSKQSWLNNATRQERMADWLTEAKLEKHMDMHTYRVHQRLPEQFPITILNFHNDLVPLEESFFCALPRAPCACHLARTRTKHSLANAGASLDWERTMLALERRGWPKLSRPHGRYLQKMMGWDDTVDGSKNNQTLWYRGEPRPNATNVVWKLCPSKQMLRQVLSVSQQFQAVLPPGEGTLSPAALEREFYEQVPTSFCDLDVEHLLDHWERHLDKKLRHIMQLLKPQR